MKTIILFIFSGMSLIYSMETVTQLNINKFMGKWYVISAIPNFVEKGCKDAYDIYELNQDGTISVEYFAQKNGKAFNIKQEATVIDTINYSKWIMKFVKPWIPLFSAPYEVIILDKINYHYMVVGYPGNDYGWIMCRNNFMDNELYAHILNRLEKDFKYNKQVFKKVIHENND